MMDNNNNNNNNTEINNNSNNNSNNNNNITSTATTTSTTTSNNDNIIIPKNSILKLAFLKRSQNNGISKYDKTDLFNTLKKIDYDLYSFCKSCQEQYKSYDPLSFYFEGIMLDCLMAMCNKFKPLNISIEDLRKSFSLGKYSPSSRLHKSIDKFKFEVFSQSKTLKELIKIITLWKLQCKDYVLIKFVSCFGTYLSTEAMDNIAYVYNIIQSYTIGDISSADIAMDNNNNNNNNNSSNNNTNGSGDGGEQQSSISPFFSKEITKIIPSGNTTTKITFELKVKDKLPFGGYGLELLRALLKDSVILKIVTDLRKPILLDRYNNDKLTFIHSLHYDSFEEFSILFNNSYYNFSGLSINNNNNNSIDKDNNNNNNNNNT